MASQSIVVAVLAGVLATTGVACGASSGGAAGQSPDGGIADGASSSDAGGSPSESDGSRSDAPSTDAATSDSGHAGDGSSPGSDGGGAAAGPAFPRLGSLDIATVHGATNAGYDSGYVQWASKIHVNVMGANWVGAGSSLYGGSREAFVQAIHQQSSIGSRVIQYYITDNTNEYWPIASVTPYILYEHGTSGTCSTNFYTPTSSTICNTNQTLFTQTDANGEHLEGQFAEAIVATMVNGAGVDAAPSMDGTFHDNTILSPTSSGDYQRNGTEEAAGDATAGAWIRAGLAEGYAYLRAHSKLVTIGNLGGWSITGQPGGGADASGLSTLVQGGIIEGELGDSWSVETWSGFAMAQSHYQFCMKNTVAPRLVLVHHSKLQANGSDPTAFDSNGVPTSYGPPYQAMRYGLALTLMDDGYYATTQDSNYYASERNWFDEYAVDPVTGVALAFPDVDAGLGYLGQPTDAPWPAPLASGVYERHFANATTGKKWVVLLNPKGNGAQTVQLGATAKKLRGTQAPAVNDGSTVTSVTLADRDGLILQLP